MSRYIGKDTVDFTGDYPIRHYIAVNADGIYDESTMIRYLKTENFFRVINIDGLRYFYLSKDELDVNEVRQAIDELHISPI